MLLFSLFQGFTSISNSRAANDKSWYVALYDNIGTNLPLKLEGLFLPLKIPITRSWYVDLSVLFIDKNRTIDVSSQCRLRKCNPYGYNFVY